MLTQIKVAEEHEEDLRLVAPTEHIYAKSVKGPARNLKWGFLVICLAIYYALPWLRWDRGAGRPNQAFLLDLAHERLYLLNFVFWPQEAYFLAGLLILGAVALFFATSLLGRVWCGYTCPQTVWTDLFMWVERRFEGDRNERYKRDHGPWTLDKLGRKVMKHAVWLGIAFWTGGAWIMYYADAPTVTVQFWTGQATREVYFFTGLFTLTTYILAGWAREQVCTYMCPWPRFQAAMLDEDTFTVTYQAWRGDPRGKLSKDAGNSKRLGDCVDCRACVHVCPTGIDIRDGQQLECINCGLCVDACSAVMKKLGRPNWLITWDTLARQAARKAGNKSPGTHLARARTAIYLGVLTLGMVVLPVAFLSRPMLGLSVQRDRAPLFVTLSDGSVRNGYTVVVYNKSSEKREFELTVEGLPGSEISVPDHNAANGAAVTLPAEADTTTTYRVLVRSGDRNLPPSTRLYFVLRDPATDNDAHYRSTFRAPGS